MLCGASAKGIRIRRQLNQPKNKFFSSANMRHQNNMISRINLLWVRWVLRCRCTRMPACCSNSGTEHRTRIHFSLMRPHYLLHYICGVAFLCRHFPLTSKMICGHWMPSSHVFASLLFHNIFFFVFFFAHSRAWDGVWHEQNVEKWPPSRRRSQNAMVSRLTFCSRGHSFVGNFNGYMAIWLLLLLCPSYCMAIRRIALFVWHTIWITTVVHVATVSAFGYFLISWLAIRCKDQWRWRLIGSS